MILEEVDRSYILPAYIYKCLDQFNFDGMAGCNWSHKNSINKEKKYYVFQVLRDVCIFRITCTGLKWALSTYTLKMNTEQGRQYLLKQEIKETNGTQRELSVKQQMD